VKWNSVPPRRYSVLTKLDCQSALIIVNLKKRTKCHIEKATNPDHSWFTFLLPQSLGCFLDSMIVFTSISECWKVLTIKKVKTDHNTFVLISGIVCEAFDEFEPICSMSGMTMVEIKFLNWYDLKETGDYEMMRVVEETFEIVEREREK
jgi:hypothetical protein